MVKKNQKRSKENPICLKWQDECQVGNQDKVLSDNRANAEVVADMQVLETARDCEAKADTDLAVDVNGNSGIARDHANVADQECPEKTYYFGRSY